MIPSKRAWIRSNEPVIVTRKIKAVVIKRPIEAPEPVRQRTPAEAISELEELRRMFIDRFGNPDDPMQRVVVRRKLSD